MEPADVGAELHAELDGGGSSRPARPASCAALQMLHGHVRGATVTVTPRRGVSMLPLSSTARLLIVTEAGPVGVQV